MSADSVTPIGPDVQSWHIWPGAVEVNRTGAELARDMLVELETVEDQDHPGGPSPADYCNLEDWPREGQPFRNVVAKYAARARALGPEVLDGFYAVLSDFVSVACAGAAFPAARYDRWARDDVAD